jgi:general transcription factor 3C polypeptide 3 (transcription factor C subunit 4)
VPDYFFRAYALDPENAMIQLYIALGYIHYGLKRQSSNRHYLVMQGFAFLFKYYDKRSKSELRVERQEAEYNMGRAYQILGLSHLAIPYYERSLELSSTNRKEPCTTEIEDFASHAAYALQSIWAVNGQVELARAVTEDWLVL